MEEKLLRHFNYILKLKYLLFLFVFFLINISCSKKNDFILNLGSENPGVATSYLVVATQDANHRALVYYNVDGTFGSAITNFRSETATPRGIAEITPGNLLVSLDITDGIYAVDMFTGEKSIFHGSSQFIGAIYNIGISAAGRVYAMESNRIEVFDNSGSRLAAAYIGTPNGICTLSSPRGMDFNANDEMVIVDHTTGDVSVYDVSADTEVCLSDNNVGNNPYDVVVHSDGYLYITTWGDDAVWRTDADGSNPTQIWQPGLKILRDPTAIVELPNGNLAVASSYLDTVEQITTAGVRVGTSPFIIDFYSLNISDMQIVEVTE